MIFIGTTVHLTEFRFIHVLPCIKSIFKISEQLFWECFRYGITALVVYCIMHIFTMIFQVLHLHSGLNATQ